jgi:protein ImuA
LFFSCPDNSQFVLVLYFYLMYAVPDRHHLPSRSVRFPHQAMMSHLSIEPCAIPRAHHTHLLEEVVGEAGHGVSASIFGLLRAREAQKRRSKPPAALLWLRTEAIARETGHLYGPGLAALGVPPQSLLMAHLKKDMDCLRAGLEGARCGGLAAVIIETEAPVELTASRRLKLSAEKLDLPIVLVRHGRHSVANAARIRWHVRAAHPPDRSRSASARPVFAVTPLKHPLGASDRPSLLEWDCDRHAFIACQPTDAALSRALVPIPAKRSLAA